jgi:hypothetical protein
MFTAQLLVVCDFSHPLNLFHALSSVFKETRFYCPDHQLINYKSRQRFNQTQLLLLGRNGAAAEFLNKKIELENENSLPNNNLQSFFCVSVVCANNNLLRDVLEKSWIEENDDVKSDS